jgi:hypothetical protein
MTNKVFKWTCEYTDTFAGEANYSWVRRGTFFTQENATQRQIVTAAKKELGLTGVRCKTFDNGDYFELRPIGSCTVAFVNFYEQA